MATELEDSLAKLCDRQRLKIEQLVGINGELLEALKNIENDDGRIPETIWAMRNAAISRAEGK